MIHSISTNGIRNAWVGNELRILQREGITLRLHSLMCPQSSYFLAPEIHDLARATHHIYPVPALQVLVSLTAAPLLFGARFWTALWNALTGGCKRRGVVRDVTS